MLKQIVILPHGTQMVISPRDNASLSLQKSANRLVEDLDASVKNWVLLSPHGLSLQGSFSVLLNSFLNGYSGVPTGVDFEDEIVNVRVRNWTEFSEKILKEAGEKNIPAEGIIGGASAIAGWIGWGEVIPLHILRKIRADSKVSVIIMPRDRVYNFEKIKPSLKKLGSLLWELLEKEDKDTMLIVSGDMAHLHSKDGPYGFSEDAKKLDDALIKWMKEPLRENLEYALRFQPNGQACGMAGFHIMQEIVEKADFSAKFYDYQVPTYFGMGLAAYFRE